MRYKVLYDSESSDFSRKEVAESFVEATGHVYVNIQIIEIDED